LVNREGGGGDELGREVVAGGGVADDEDVLASEGVGGAVELGVDYAAREGGDVGGEALDGGDLGGGWSVSCGSVGGKAKGRTGAYIGHGVVSCGEDDGIELFFPPDVDVSDGVVSSESQLPPVDFPWAGRGDLREVFECGSKNQKRVCLVAGEIVLDVLPRDVVRCERAVGKPPI